MSKAKAKKFPVPTVPSCVAALGAAELVCFHGMFDEDESQQGDEDEGDKQERGFYVSVINAKTFKVIKTRKLELPENCGNLGDCEQVDPIYTIMTISPSKRFLAVTLGHEEYSAALLVDLSDMSVKHVEENVEQHDQVRVVFLSDTAALISSCGSEYSPWRKVTNWADEAACQGGHSYERFEGDEEAGVTFLILGSNEEQTQYAVRRRYLLEEQDRGPRKNYRDEILIYDINTDEVVRTISLYGRSLAANVAISGDFETLWDWFGAEDYRCFDVNDGELKIWKTTLSSDTTTVELSGTDSGVETDFIWDTPCDFIHVGNVFFKQSLCDGKVEDEGIGDFRANIQLTEDKEHFVIGNGAGVLKIFSANTGALEVSTNTGKENEWDVFSNTFYREQYNSVFCGNAQMLLFGFDAESTRSVYSVAVPAPSAAAAVGSKSSRRGGNVAVVVPSAVADTIGIKRQISAIPLSDSAAAYLECHEGTSNKFYRIQVVDECTVLCHYGPIGGGSVNRTEKTFASPEEATAFTLKTLKEKRRKGYVDASEVPVPITQSPVVAAAATDEKKATTAAGPICTAKSALEEASGPPQKALRNKATAPALVGSRRSPRGAL